MNFNDISFHLIGNVTHCWQNSLVHLNVYYLKFHTERFAFCSWFILKLLPLSDHYLRFDWIPLFVPTGKERVCVSTNKTAC